MKRITENLKLKIQDNNSFKTASLLCFCIIIVFFMTLPAWAGTDQWTTNGPYGGYISALAVSPNYSSDNTIYAGALNGRIYKTTDGGANWTAADAGIVTSDYPALALAVSPNYSID